MEWDKEDRLKEIAATLIIHGANPEELGHKGGEACDPACRWPLIDPNALCLKIFVDTMQNGKLKLGHRALIFLDTYPDSPFTARVVRISQKADFTPKEVSVRSDRIRRVFAVSG